MSLYFLADKITILSDEALWPIFMNIFKNYEEFFYTLIFVIVLKTLSKQQCLIFIDTFQEFSTKGDVSQQFIKTFKYKIITHNVNKKSSKLSKWPVKCQNFILLKS